MNLTSIEYVIQEAFTGIRRNGVMAFASITTVALSLTVLGAFALAALSASNFATVQLREFEIAVFTDRGISDSDVNKIAQDIRKIQGVKTVEMRSRSEEWRRIKLEQPGFETAGTTESVLPYALDVRVDEPSLTSRISTKIREMKNVDDVNFASDTFDKVMSVVKAVRAIGYFGVLVLLVVTAMIVSNAIRLTLYARRAEIRTMQLVGATNQFIRIPLVLEGVLFGILGAIVAWTLLRVGSSYFSSASITIPALNDLRSGIGSSELITGLVIIGSIIGAAGSLLSMRRFLHD